jgi:hypothetical protein
LETYLDGIVQWIALTMMLVGLVGLIIPILPGLVIIWASALGYGIYAGFATPGWIFFAIMTVLMLAGSLVDNFLMGAKAYKEGAAWWAILIALVAAVIGQIFIPIPVVGGVIVAVLALFLIEWARRKDTKKAWIAVRGMMIGCGWAVAIRFIIGVVMIGLWMIWAWA